MAANLKIPFDTTNKIHNTNHIRNQKAAHNQQTSNTVANGQISSAVSLELSSRGLALAETLPEFDDTYETEMLLLKGIGSRETISGSFMDILAQNYRDEQDRITASYSGDEREKQLTHLNSAFDKASASMARAYVKQLRILTGDIELKPGHLSADLASTEAKAEAEAEARTANSKDSGNDKDKKTVISADEALRVGADIKNMLWQLAKRSGADSALSSGTLTYRDIKQLCTLLLHKNTDYDAGSFSGYAGTVLEQYRSNHAVTALT